MRKYMEIARNISEKIFYKDFKKQLPSENELMAQYQVSRNTIRNAIAILANHGIVKRVQGSGYFINQQLINNNELMLMASKDGIHPTRPQSYEDKNTILKKLKTKILSFKTLKANELTAEALGCELGADLYYIERLRYFNDELFCLEKTYYLKKVVPYLDEKICQGSIFEFIQKQFNIEVNDADEFIKMTYTDKKDSEKLNIPAKTPNVQITEINYLRNNIAFNYSIINYFNSDISFYNHVTCL